MIGRDSGRRSRDHHCKDDPCNSFAIARGGIEGTPKSVADKVTNILSVKPIPPLMSVKPIPAPAVSIPGAGGGGLHAAWPTQTMAASGSGFEKWPLPVPPDGASYGEVIHVEPQPARSDHRNPRSTSPWSPYHLSEESCGIQRSDARLPAHHRYDEIVSASRDRNIYYVRGATGCGKSTQIPQIIAENARCEDGWSKQRIWLVMPYVEGTIGV